MTKRLFHSLFLETFFFVNIMATTTVDACDSSTSQPDDGNDPPSLSLSFSLCLSLFVFNYLSLRLSLSLIVFHYLSLHISLSLFVFLCISPFLFLPFCGGISLSACLSLHFSLTLFFYFHVFLHLLISSFFSSRLAICCFIPFISHLCLLLFFYYCLINFLTPTI
jgi:hypothetical protein